MTTAFGPHGPNYSTTRPATLAQSSGGSDTWCVDCSAAGAKDGTVLDASFFNIIIANLRTAVRNASVTLDDSDTMLYDAIVALITANVSGVFSANTGVKLNGTTFQLTLGDGSQTTLTDTTVSAVNDKIQVFDASAATQSEMTIYNAVKAVLAPSTTGVTFNDAAGTITIAGITQTAATTAPAGATPGDEWYNPSTDILYKYVNDGTSSFWREI